ncbi:metabotropic glutamate receptor-like [Acanthaster planci]|uniref:Metabotropic glutamate receptor-like n=1 Tax=Acanthaster planci TaxID=133434 RepID=A0A8B7YYX8_ACAPL|nr:metabotropic glutamate receptor-like [Acanthaster planci]
MILSLLLIFLSTTFGLSMSGIIPEAAHISLNSPGDVILGASFSFHTYSSPNLPACSGNVLTYGSECAALVLYTIDSINNRTDLLPNVTIGYDIRDNCYSEAVSLWSAFGLASTSEKPQEDIQFTNILGTAHGKLIGIIGTQSSSTSIPTAQAASLYRVPVISPFATSNELSNKRRFPYFLRTVPPDSLQASAIVDILQHFGWKYIGLYFQLSAYGIHGAQGVLDLTEERDICVAFSVALRTEAQTGELEEAVAKLAIFRKARVVVIFGDTGIANRIFRTIASKEDIASLNITFIGSDGWATPGSLLEYGVDLALMHGTIFVNLVYKVVPGFHDYYRFLLQRSGKASIPWFEDLKRHIINKYDCSDFNQCPMKIYGNAPFIVDAVYAFAYALQNFLTDRCNNSDDCNATLQALYGHDLLPYLHGLKFEGLVSNYSFDSDGNPSGKYGVFNFQFKGNNDYEMAELGTWDALAHNRLNINTSAIQWADGTLDPPVSVCRDICSSGYIEVPLEQKCCFGCQRCPDEAIVSDKKCKSCSVDEWPDENFEVCQPIVPTPPSWSEPTVIAVLILSGFGLFLSLLAAFGIYYYRGHVLIKAASRELSSINILGLTLAFLAPFPLLVPPTAVSCRASEIIITLCFTLTYAPTLLKVNRIYRIFDAGRKSNKCPRYIGPKVQLIFALGIVASMVVVAVAGALANPTLPAKLYFYPRRNYIEVFCQFGNGFLASLVSNLFLVLACCYYAFKARKVPSNYNESRFIAISVYSTLVFGMAAVPVYITATTVLQKVATLCVAILLNAFLALFCVYLPKLYAIQLDREVEVSEWRVSNTGLSGQTTSTAASASCGRAKVQPE